MHNYRYFEETISLDPERDGFLAELLYVQRLLEWNRLASGCFSWVQMLSYSEHEREHGIH